MVKRSKQLESSQAEGSQKMEEMEKELTASQLRTSQVTSSSFFFFFCLHVDAFICSCSFGLEMSYSKVTMNVQLFACVTRLRVSSMR